MQKLSQSKKKISILLTPEEYNTLTLFAEKENRKISNAARIIVVRYLRESKKNEAL